MLNEIADLVDPQLSIEEILEVIYENVNQLTDAYQFCVGIYDEKEGLIHYKGLIENGRRLPSFSVDILDETRLASWCVRNGRDIFINDFDREFSKYLSVKPKPITGIQPQAALYTPLKLDHKTVGVVVVRTIRKNVYRPHHLHLLKTVGNFVVRALELARRSAIPFVQGEGRKKEWLLNSPENLKTKSGKQLQQLTLREKQVLLSLAGGLSNKEIGEKLFVSPDTIKTHTLNIYRKMEVGNRSSAILKAVELRWII